MKFLPDSPVIYWGVKAARHTRKRRGKRSLSDNVQKAMKQYIANNDRRTK